MASYGLSVVNDNGVVSIDSEYARLCVLQSGTYAGSTSVSVPFIPAITTQEPPLLFLRPNNNSGSVTVGCSISGSPGNWTGMTISGTANTSISGKYFVGGFAASPVSSYGMRLWDGAGALIFDSGTPSAVFTRFFQNWTYVRSTQDAQGYYTNWYSSPFSSSTDEYLMINNASMRMLSGDNVGRLPRIVFDFAASQLWFTTTALSNPFAFSLPAIFAKIVA
ncbi:hypothetical protein KTQ74_31750 [Pseudomonas chlororaphis]|uniref:hypothetical protein n=1 Tax=Pseudomonas chlororaphis TaxID=587753 RepID=UPI001E5D501E|nr:hypothetical protein [Pseudomonas chlororaphis]MCB2256502.1 hypothetical protein [Pseudomonas chlororaphis]